MKLYWSNSDSYSCFLLFAPLLVLAGGRKSRLFYCSFALTQKNQKVKSGPIAPRGLTGHRHPRPADLIIHYRLLITGFLIGGTLLVLWIPSIHQCVRWRRREMKLPGSKAGF